MSLGVIRNSLFRFITKHQVFLAYLSILSLYVSVTFFKLSLHLKFEILKSKFYACLFLYAPQISGPDMSSFLMQSVKPADCESPTYWAISMSVIVCTPINIFLSSVYISVFPFGYGTSTKTWPKIRLSYISREGCSIIWQSFNTSNNYYATPQW